MQIFPLKLIPNDLNINFISLNKINYIISILLILLSITSLITLKLNFGIDFVGGLNLEIKVHPVPNLAKIRTNLDNSNLGKISIQNFGNEDIVLIKVSNNLKDINTTVVTDKIKNILEKDLNYKIEYRKVDFVGPQVGSHLIKSSIQAILLAFVFIMIYVWFRFEWQFSLGVLISIIHDIILSIGFISISGLDFNLSSIAALLTIIGYSVNDSIVIYDRVRENLKKLAHKKLQDIINISINETLSRTILTVLTTLLANSALILFGGEAIKSFSISVFIGIIIGTYSSIFISAPILVLFNLKKSKQ